jgi:hypothetical protein
MTIEEARQTFQKACSDDPDFRMAYQANIAMLIDDDQHRLINTQGGDYDECNEPEGACYDSLRL